MRLTQKGAQANGGQKVSFPVASADAQHDIGEAKI